ncbi:MAG TPA: SDR family NAD(P)-dependent oxidoreductase, partial [Methylomirabilota bacterium]|nr:SDR family NAD(P)-dependent oxidoreductase [Methylomirabilota bacterium]
LPVQADVTREPEVRTMVGRVAREPGGLDGLEGLVNNAGWAQRVPHRQLDVVPHTEPRPEGAIVNITSVAHAASKAGLDTLTKPLARALAPSRIRVNAVAPGPADPRSR